jgi:hypothetical protein
VEFQEALRRVNDILDTSKQNLEQYLEAADPQTWNITLSAKTKDQLPPGIVLGSALKCLGYRLRASSMEILIAAAVRTLDFIRPESSTICTQKTRAISFASITSQPQEALELDVTPNEAILEQMKAELEIELKNNEDYYDSLSSTVHQIEGFGS